MTFIIDIPARALRCPVPLRMAVSPPVTAISATMGERHMKCKVWSPHVKVNALSKGLAMMHSNVPATAVIRLHDRIMLIVPEMCSASLFSYDSAMFLTALIDMPRFVVLETRFIVELKRDISPIPKGPNISATNLFLTIDMRRLRNCMPPNNPVYFRMCE